MMNSDWRYMLNGFIMPTESGYCDQPSIVRASDGSWVCSITTGRGGEGAKGQYVSIIRSSDRGKTWSTPLAIEPGPWESAYSSLAVAPSGRIYCFYCYNLDQVDIERAKLKRYDMGGYYCYRISEDCGKTWSERRVVPVRDFEIDRQQEEPYREFEGKPLRFFWNVSRVFFDGNTCYSALIKYHYKDEDVLYSSEGVLLKCCGLDDDPDHAVWQTLPDGEIGLRTPPGGGRVAEEQCFVKLSDGTIFCIYRTIDGHPACTLSRDGGHTFETPRYLQYANGRRIKHNRAATFLWPLGEGRYLLWFNNHSLTSYNRRNPIWCALGIETPTPNGLTLEFSQPEILLYHQSEHIGMSYPDLLYDGDWYVTETQKSQARIHRIEKRFIEKLCGQFAQSVQDCGAPVYCANYQDADSTFPEIVFSRPTLQDQRDYRQINDHGYTVALFFENARAGETLFSTRDVQGGLLIGLDQNGNIRVWMGDVMANCTLQGSWPLNDGRAHRLALILDIQANLAYLVVDGIMDDGGERAPAGWQWMNRSMIALPACKRPALGKAVAEVRLYDRALLTCEAASIKR